MVESTSLGIVCNEWNFLTEDVVSTGSLNTIKARLDHHLRNVRGFVYKHLVLFPLIAIHEQLPWLEGWQTVNGYLQRSTGHWTLIRYQIIISSTRDKIVWFLGQIV